MEKFVKTLKKCNNFMKISSMGELKCILNNFTDKTQLDRKECKSES